jgi:hypothetical protein
MTWGTFDPARTRLVRIYLEWNVSAAQRRELAGGRVEGE